MLSKRLWFGESAFFAEDNYSRSNWKAFELCLSLGDSPSSARVAIWHHGWWSLSSMRLDDLLRSSESAECPCRKFDIRANRILLSVRIRRIRRQFSLLSHLYPVGRYFVEACFWKGVILIEAERVASFACPSWFITTDRAGFLLFCNASPIAILIFLFLREVIWTLQKMYFFRTLRVFEEINNVY